MDADRARRLITQHAETARFLGVDFVPVRYDLAGVDAPDTGGGALGGPGFQGEDRGGEAPARAPAASAYTPIEIPEGELTPERAQALLDEVRARYERDEPHRHFVTDHHSIVFGEGDPRADLMFVGEAPGETEDRTGRPFVGKAGQLLDKMIVAMGLGREKVYICNVLKTRPPNNQTPTIEEATLCAPYLLDQIRVVQPKVIVTLGLPATRLLLDASEPMRALRGRFHAVPPDSGGFPGGIFGPVAAMPKIRVMPTYHPAYLLRSPTVENRRKVWSDLQQVMGELGLGAG